MKDIDKLIAETLDADGAAEFENLGEQDIFARIADTFRGKSRNLVLLAFGGGAVMVGLGFYSAFRFFSAAEVRDQILWAAIAVICLLGHGLVKVWYWMELNRNSIMREIKRVELQVARLSAKRKD